MLKEKIQTRLTADKLYWALFVGLILALCIVVINHSVWLYNSVPRDTYGRMRAERLAQQQEIDSWQETSKTYMQENSFQNTDTKFTVAGINFEVDFNGEKDVVYDIYRTSESTWWVGWSRTTDSGTTLLAELYIGGKVPDTVAQIKAPGSKPVYFTKDTPISVSVAKE